MVYYVKGDYDKAMSDIDKSISYSHNSLVFSFRGYIYSGEKKYEMALADYSEAIKLEPKNPGLYIFRADASTGLGYYEASLIDLNTAILLLSNMHDKSQALARAYDARAVIYSLQKNDQCFDDFDRAIHLEPKNGKFYLHRADVYLIRDNYTNALADYCVAINLDSNNASAYLGRGQLFALEGDYFRAIDDYTVALHIDSNLWRAYEAMAWVLAAAPDNKVRNGKEALLYAQKACALTLWQKSGPIEALAAACAEQGDFVEAIKWQEKSIKIQKASGAKPAAQKRLNLYRDNQPYRLPKS